MPKLIYIKASDKRDDRLDRAASPASAPTTPPPTCRSRRLTSCDERVADDLATLLAERFDQLFGEGDERRLRPIVRCTSYIWASIAIIRRSRSAARRRRGRCRSAACRCRDTACTAVAAGCSCRPPPLKPRASQCGQFGFEKTSKVRPAMWARNGARLERRRTFSSCASTPSRSRLRAASTSMPAPARTACAARTAPAFCTSSAASVRAKTRSGRAARLGARIGSNRSARVRLVSMSGGHLHQPPIPASDESPLPRGLARSTGPSARCYRAGPPAKADASTRPWAGFALTRRIVRSGCWRAST